MNWKRVIKRSFKKKSSAGNKIAVRATFNLTLRHANLMALPIKYNESYIFLLTTLWVLGLKIF